MKICVFGSREITSYSSVEVHLDEFKHLFTELVSGRCAGADLLGETWALKNNIPIQTFPVLDADWRKFGLSAGPRRNRIMASYSEMGIGFKPEGKKTKGTSNMKDELDKLGKKVYLFSIRV